MPQQTNTPSTLEQLQKLFKSQPEPSVAFTQLFRPTEMGGNTADEIIEAIDSLAEEVAADDKHLPLVNGKKTKKTGFPPKTQWMCPVKGGLREMSYEQANSEDWIYWNKKSYEFTGNHSAISSITGAREHLLSQTEFGQDVLAKEKAHAEAAQIQNKTIK